MQAIGNAMNPAGKVSGTSNEAALRLLTDSQGAATSIIHVMDYAAWYTSRYVETEIDLDTESVGSRS
jgi:hypothetical protein